MYKRQQLASRMINVDEVFIRGIMKINSVDDNYEIKMGVENGEV